jgi:hypothetical protein
MPQAQKEPTSVGVSPTQTQSQTQSVSQLAPVFRRRPDVNRNVTNDAFERCVDRARDNPTSRRDMNECIRELQGLNPPLAQEVRAGPSVRASPLRSKGLTDSLALGHQHPEQEPGQEAKPSRPVQPRSVRRTGQLSKGPTTVHSKPTKSRLRQKDKQTESG